MERLSNSHGVLACHGINNQEGVVRLHLIGDLPHLRHQLGIDCEATRSIDNEDISSQATCLCNGRSGNVHWITYAREDHLIGSREHRHINLSGQSAQLSHCGGPLQVGTHQHGVAPLCFEPLCQLGRVGGFTGALEASHQHHSGRLGCVGDAEGLAAQGLGEFFEDDLLDL